MAITRVKLIPLSEAVPGMVLEKDVRNSLGVVLLKAGVALTDASIAGLAGKNVGHLSVRHEDERSEEELAAERARVTEHIDHLFRNVAQEGTMAALRRIILEYRLENLSS